MPNGVLPKQTIRKMCEAGFIKDVGEEFLNPASIDMPLSNEVYRIKGTFLPRGGQKIRDLLPQLEATPHPITQPLAPGVSYLIRIAGKWWMPTAAYGYANPKSSTGRIGLLCRIVADGVDMYDSVPSDFHGELWALVEPWYFTVLVHEGHALAQLRFFSGKSFLSEVEMEIAFKKDGILFTPQKRRIEFSDALRRGDSLYLTLNVGKKMGYMSRAGRASSLPVIDIARRDHNPKDFFEPVGSSNGLFTFEKGRLYILSTWEHVLVAPTLSAELRPIDVRLGEFRSHAAGYIDSGWGLGDKGSEKGRPITLEIIPFENATMQHRQKIAQLRYERMAAEPEVLYDSAQSNYTKQKGAKLSKHFKK